MQHLWLDDVRSISVLKVCDALEQERALLTYIRRVYYPFLLRDPEITPVDGMLCAYWVHTHPTLSGMPQVAPLDPTSLNPPSRHTSQRYNYLQVSKTSRFFFSCYAPWIAMFI